MYTIEFNTKIQTAKCSQTRGIHRGPKKEDVSKRQSPVPEGGEGGEGMEQP